MTESLAPDRDFIILALPWQRYDTTAIQLGALQSWLTERGFTVDTRHFYKDLVSYISPAVYLRIFDAYMGESAFAALMFPERYDRIKQAVSSCVDFDLSMSADSGPLKHPQLNANLSLAEREQMTRNVGSTATRQALDFDGLVDQLALFLDDVEAAVDWSRYKVIGFTTSHQQLIPTVLLARRLKARWPDTPIVIGGALMTQGIPQAVLRLFECFDIVVEGEGEETATELLGVLTGRDGDRRLADIRGIVWRRTDADGSDEIVRNLPRAAMHDIDKLPSPDYDDYFRHALRADAVEIIPKLTIEASRACVWGKCTYCNLNVQWNNLYRRKSHLRVAHELAELRHKYRSPYVTFCDTNVEDKIPLFEQLADDPYDYRILVEVSPNVTREGVRALRDGGVRTIQAGIESFSDRVLRLYQRNHRLMRSLELLKWSCEYDIEIYYNIIINFPAETVDDVQRSIAVVDYAKHFMYPSVHDYSFTMDSPAWNDMAAYNIDGWSLPQEVTDVYPDEYARELAQLLALTIKPVPAEDNGVDWTEFLTAVDGWKRRFHGNLGRPGMVYVDGGDFLNVTIRAGGDGNDIVMQLPDEYRTIYLACVDRSRTVEEIAAAVPTVPSRQVADILEELHELKVVYSERNRSLALAVRERDIGNYPAREIARSSARRPELPLVEFEPADTRRKQILHRTRSGHDGRSDT